MLVRGEVTGLMRVTRPRPGGEAGAEDGEEGGLDIEFSDKGGRG